MKDFRLVMLSTDPDSDYWFVVYEKALCKADAVSAAAKHYAPGFEVDEYKTTEIAE